MALFTSATFPWYQNNDTITEQQQNHILIRVEHKIQTFRKKTKTIYEIGDVF